MIEKITKTATGKASCEADCWMAERAGQRWNPMQNKSQEERRSIALKSAETREKNKEAKDLLRKQAEAKVNGLINEIDILEKRLAGLKRMEILGKQATELTGKMLLTEEMIVKSSFPCRNVVGVYFLISCGRVVYVGQSVSIHSRIAQHAKDKSFDSFAYIRCLTEILDKLESLYIHLLRPALNGVYKNGVPNAPITLDDLIG